MKTTKTLADFKAQFDPDVVVPNKIKAALASLLKEGPESWEMEAEIIKRAGISQTQMSAYRGQFEKHIVSARSPGKDGKRIWFADAKVAAKARGE